MSSTGVLSLPGKATVTATDLALYFFQLHAVLSSHPLPDGVKEPSNCFLGTRRLTIPAVKDFWSIQPTMYPKVERVRAGCHLTRAHSAFGYTRFLMGVREPSQRVLRVQRLTSLSVSSSLTSTSSVALMRFCLCFLLLCCSSLLPDPLLAALADSGSGWGQSNRPELVACMNTQHRCIK